MTCGFTGTQRGMAPRQLKAVRQLLYKVDVLHLGDCIGADHEAYGEARALGITCIGHPPAERIKRTLCRYDEEREPRSYLLRNRDIPSEGVDGLIAAPKEFVEARRSGTWATIRAARKLGRRIWIVLPDGRVKQEPEQKAAAICYVDHETGDVDHINAHVETSKCKDDHGA